MNEGTILSEQDIVTRGDFFTIKMTPMLVIDFDKVQTVEDVKNVLKGLNLKFYGAQKAELEPYLVDEVKE